MANKAQITASKNGIGFGSLLFLVFLVLKLAEIGTVATWSWWWVTSPLWIPVALVLSFAIIIYSGAIILDFLDDIRYKLKKKK